MSRVLRLTLLAPEIVEAILDGRQPAEMQVDDLLSGFPLEWEGQRSRPHHPQSKSTHSPLCLVARPPAEADDQR